MAPLGFVPQVCFVAHLSRTLLRGVLMGQCYPEVTQEGYIQPPRSTTAAAAKVPVLIEMQKQKNRILTLRTAN